MTSANKKKVAMLFSMSFLPVQGRYLRTYNEAKTLSDNGYDVTMIAWDRELISPEKESLNGIHVERLRIPAGFQAGPIKNLPKILTFYKRAIQRLWKSDFDVIHCFNLDTIIPGLLVGRLKRKKVVLDLCEPNYYANWKPIFQPVYRLINFFEKFFSRRFDRLFVHNLYQMDKFGKFGIKSLLQIGSYPNLSLVVNKVNARPDSESVVIGRLGSIYHDNGIEETIEAFQMIRKKYPKCKLLLAGKVFANYKSTFEKLIQPVKDYLILIGQYAPSDMPELYSKIDISVMLYRRTEFFRNVSPTKFFDSLASGVPLVTSDIGDLRLLTTQYNCGVIVDETNPQDICRGFETLIRDPDLRRTIAENGLKLAREKFNWEAEGRKLLKSYESL
jgi:glycosyltransferase involved in cell wall biosynthesis